ICCAPRCGVTIASVSALLPISLRNVLVGARRGRASLAQFGQTGANSLAISMGQKPHYVVKVASCEKNGSTMEHTCAPSSFPAPRPPCPSFRGKAEGARFGFGTFGSSSEVTLRKPTPSEPSDRAGRVLSWLGPQECVRKFR